MDSSRHRAVALVAAVCGIVGLLVLPGAPARATADGSGVSPRTAAGSRGDLLTYDYDNARSGDDAVDPTIAGLSEAPLWNDDHLDGGVYAEPLVYGGTVYVATEDDSVYAIGARSGKVMWRVHVGNAVARSVVDSTPGLSGCGDIDPEGITSTPVIDPTSGVLFASEETEPGGGANWRDVRFWLVAISLSTHRELWHRQIDPPGGNSSSYDVPAEQQRSAITLANGRIYVPFGGLYGDCGQYHGYVVAVPVSGSGALATYEVPTAREGAIWGTNGAAVSSSGDLYVATGNGSSESVRDFDEGNAVIELSPSLGRLGVWAPSNWVQLNDEDWDLGSAGPIQVPGTDLLFVAGKPAANGSFGYLMEEGHLGGIGRGATTERVCPSGGVFGADAAAVVGSRTMVYVPCGSGTVALSIDAAARTFTRAWSVSTGAPNGPPIVAGGVVWALDWNDAALFGMNPSTGRVIFERATDQLEHFATPGVGDAMVLVPTAGGVEGFRATR